MKGKLCRLPALLLVVASLLMLCACPAGHSPLPSAPPSSDVAPPPEDRFGSVAEELHGHVYLSGRAQGSCARLCGDVAVTAVFVNDAQHTFSEAEKSQYLQDFSALLARIEQDAASFGAAVRLQLQYYTADSTVPLVRSDAEPWARDAFEQIGVQNNVELEALCDVQEAPVVLITGQQGRSFAQRSSAKTGREYVVLYNDFDAAYHELLHLFGARDFYFPERVEQLAQTLLPESIMLDNQGQVDDLTAYLVGWTDDPSPEALSFLEQTADLTAAQLDAAHEVEVFTGYVTDRRSSGGSYTGYLVDGVRHGEGTFVWDSGARYTGSWDNGDLHGYGEYYYGDGDVYKGDWVRGAKHGTGRYTWQDGTVYQGDWKDDERTGKGTMTWPDGARYQGDFVDGERHGQGTYSWPNGDRFVGGWKNGKRHGKGTYTWADGSSRTGSWKNGDFVG